MTDVRRLSEAIFVGLSHAIGTHEQVSMRRDIVDIKDAIENKIDWFYGQQEMLSGSYREGFRLLGSDQDIMYWPRDHKVISDLSQTQHYRQLRTTFFLMEYVESRPGFALLQILTPSPKREVRSACVKVNNVFYISSTIYRKQILRLFPGIDYTEHGPCANVVFSSYTGDTFEFDAGYCFSCDYWPPLAVSWIQRCSCWPSPAVVYEIIVSGCHFMAIGSKGSPSELLEWRVSFSQAEQKLVYAMNHCQFLVYGLLKLFLKEVINQGDHENLLCSYFMKTAVFWEIQDNSILFWCPQNIVICFWSCFKRIIKWVYHGYCPNFFIAENNMFWNKIYGSAQDNLFLHLHKLYQKGWSCLLYCTSIRSYLYETLYNPPTVIHLHENNGSSEVTHALNIFSETTQLESFCATGDISRSLRYLKTIEYLSKTNLTKCLALHLHVQATECLTDTAFCLHQTHSGGNRSMYNADSLSCKLLKLVARSGCLFHMLFLAIIYYKTGRYTKAVTVLHIIEVQFNRHNLTHNGCGRLEKYIVDIGGHCLLDVWKLWAFQCFILHNALCYVNQLTLEQRVAKGKGSSLLFVPPLLLLRMLYVLCYKHVNQERREEALHSLYTIVHHDTGTYITDQFRDISYQLLGVSQEICGDYSSAIQSYYLSLKCQPFNKITEASLIRIKHALAQL